MTAEILALEKRRNDALLTNDAAALTELIDKDLVHIHTSGRQENREEYLNGVKENLEFLSIKRGDLQVRVFDSVAIMTGALHQTIRLRKTGATVQLDALATQVWVKKDNAWQLVSFQATRMQGS